MTTKPTEPTSDVVAWLRDAMDAAQRDAEVVAEEVGGADWEYKAGEYITATGPAGFRVITGTDGYLEPARGRFMAAQDPATVLRRIAADRKLLGLHADAAGKCVECGQGYESGDWGPDFPCATVRLLAESWGWTEAP